MDINIPFYKMSKAQKTQLYMDNLTVIFNPQALFSDGTAFYRNPSEPDCFEEVHLRFRTGRENVDEVILVLWLIYSKNILHHKPQGNYDHNSFFLLDQ